MKRLLPSLASACLMIPGTALAGNGPAETEPLIRALREGRIDVERTTPDAMMGGLVAMSGFDAIRAGSPTCFLVVYATRIFHTNVFGHLFTLTIFCFAASFLKIISGSSSW